MAKIILTAEDVKNADSYVDVEKKKMMAELMTTFCVEERQDPNDGRVLPLPPQARENRMIRQMFLMGVLAEMYFHKKVKYQTIRIEKDGKSTEKAIALLMDADEYNEWASSAVFNQLERLKKKRDDVADKVFDLTADFRLFESMLLGAIRDEIAARNDPADRLASILAMNSAPETIEAAKAEALKAAETAKGE